MLYNNDHRRVDVFTGGMILSYDVNVFCSCKIKTRDFNLATTPSAVMRRVKMRFSTWLIVLSYISSKIRAMSS
jgi:hypothetical protein